VIGDRKSVRPLRQPALFGYRADTELVTQQRIAGSMRRKLQRIAHDVLIEVSTIYYMDTHTRTPYIPPLHFLALHSCHEPRGAASATSSTAP
jgi:hypothetical protein